MFRKLMSLIGDVAVFGLSSVLGQVLSFLLLPLYTRRLSTADYGDVGQLLILYAIFAPLANLGMTIALFRFYRATLDDERRKRSLNTVLVSVVSMSLILLAIGVVIAPTLKAVFFKERVSEDLIRLTLLSAACAAVTTIPQSLLRCQRRVKVTASFNIFKLLITIFSTVYFVIFCQMKVLGVVLGILAGDAAIMIALFAATIRSYDLRGDLALWREMLQFGIPFTPHHLQAVALAQFGQYMLYEKLGPDEAGIYNTAAKFAVPLSVAIGAIQNAWVPFKYQIQAEDADPKSFFRFIVTYYFAGVSYLWLGVSVWGPEMVRLMTDPQYHAAVLYVPLVALISVATGAYFMLGTGLEVSNNTRPMPLVSLSGLIVTVASAFTLIPILNLHGAAIATVLGWTIMAIVVFRLAQARFFISYDWTALASFALSAGLIVTFAWWTQQQMWPLGLRLLVAFAASCVYPAIVAMVLLRSSSERHRMKILFEQLRRRFGRNRMATDTQSS